MKSTYLIVICLFSFVAMNCVDKENTGMQENETMIVTAPIVYKNYETKKGFATDRIDAYLQISAEYYYIKFSESHISAEDLELHLANMDNDQKIFKAEIEIRSGYWDISDSDINDLNDPLPQSRIGKYVVIHNIIESED